MYHAGLGDREKAISCYEAGNISGLNDVAIASNRVSLGQYEEALPALSHGIVRGMAQLFNAGSGALRCLMAGGELQEADALCQWLIRMLEGMEAGEGSYVYKMRAVLCARHAAILLAQGDEEAARQRLELAMESARRFDAAPDFALQSIRFYHGEDKAMTDGMGETAMDALGRIIDQSGALSERLRALLPG